MTNLHALVWLAVARTGAALLHNAPVLRASPARAVRGGALRMAALAPGANVLAVGNGPVFLLSAKTAAQAGYKVTIVSNRKELFDSLLWSPARDETPDANLRILGVESDEDVSAFNEAVATADGLIIAFDGEQVLTDSLLDVVLPAEGGASRVACLSKSLSGKGMGPFVSASKVAANNEVWAAPEARVAMYKEFEAKLKKGGREVTVVRAGTMKGGGPGDPDNAAPPSMTLSEKFYAELPQKDLVNWQLLFDCETRGIALTPGDTASGPGFKAVFTSTSSNAEPGDAGRVALAQALVRSLSREDAANKEFGVSTAEGRDYPSDADWDAALSAVL